MKKTLLITGWTWYIGSHAVVAFEQAWYKTVLIDNLVNSSKNTLKNIGEILWYTPDFFEWDLRDKDFLEQVFSKYSFDWVLHFAWLKAVWESTQKPLEYFDNNIVGSLRLFEVMEKFSVKKIIFSSSATVYNFDNQIPYMENQNLWDTTNTYATTKYLIEKILNDLSKFSWFNVINLRYFNPIWAHSSWLIWENPEWIPNNLLPFIMKVALWQLPYVNVFGDDYDTPDGSWVRDYIDIEDLIDGHLKAYQLLENLDFVWFIDDFNLWSWKGISVFQIIDASKKIIGKEIPFQVVWRRSWDIGEFYCNPTKAKNILDWQPKKTLEESLEKSFRL